MSITKIQQIKQSVTQATCFLFADNHIDAFDNDNDKHRQWGDSGTVVEKSFSNQKVASSIPCRSVLEQDTEPLIAPDVQCAISVKLHICKSLWIKASAKRLNVNVK